jgi:hypothetical protein
MQCSEKIYHQNEFGVTRKCECHNAVHLNFGNISLLLSKPQLSDFSTYVADAAMSCTGDGFDMDDRSIYIPTRDPALMFIMSLRELKALVDLTEQTLLMLQVEEALSADDRK